MEDGNSELPLHRWIQGVSLTSLRWGFEELGSKDDRIRFWANIGNDRGVMSSFDEASCAVFDDSCYVDSRMDLASALPERCAAVDRLGKAMDACDGCAEALVLIGSREMEIVRQAARDALRFLPEGAAIDAEQTSK